MARENMVSLPGQVMLPPRVHINSKGEEFLATMLIRVLRRPTNGQGFDSKLYIDCPIVRTANNEMISKIRNLSAGDMVDIKGVITTLETKKSSICPHCNTKNYKDGNVVFVTPIYICQREVGVSEEKALALLKERSEISNLAVVIGNVCREPHFYEDADKKAYAQYQLAVNRRYRIRENADDIKTDYPWIKTFGKQALEDSKCLKIGSSVYISGALQSRDIKRKTVCEHCCESYEWDESVLEIVPYYIGYLANCDVLNEDVETAEIALNGLGTINEDGGESLG